MVLGGEPRKPKTIPDLPIAWTPSRGREIDGLFAMAAAQSQPSGAALPSLIVGSPLSASQHFEAAASVRPFTLLLDRAVSPAVKDALARCARHPSMMVNHRKAALDAFTELSEVLAPLSARWRNALGEGAPSKGVNFALIQFMISHFGYDDEVFAYDVARGMPIAGDVPACASLTPRVKPATRSVQEWTAELATRNRQLLERVTRSASDPMVAACWEKTMEEVQRGWVTPPVPVTEALLNSLPLTPRFAIPQKEGAKVRVIDDFKASGINAVMSTVDTNIPESLDVFLAHAAFIKRISPATELRAFALDFSHAYKNVPILDAQKDFASIILADPQGAPFVATLRSQPFGSRRAPSNWARVTQFLKWLLLKFFDVPVAVFVDDRIIFLANAFYNHFVLAQKISLSTRVNHELRLRPLLRPCKKCAHFWGWPWTHPRQNPQPRV